MLIKEAIKSATLRLIEYVEHQHLGSILVSRCLEIIYLWNTSFCLGQKNTDTGWRKTDKYEFEVFGLHRRTFVRQ